MAKSRSRKKAPKKAPIVKTEQDDFTGERVSVRADGSIPMPKRKAETRLTKAPEIRAEFAGQEAREKGQRAFAASQERDFTKDSKKQSLSYEKRVVAFERWLKETQEGKYTKLRLKIACENNKVKTVDVI